MTGKIREYLRYRGLLVPGDDPSRLLPQGWGAKSQERPKRAIMRTNKGSDLRWPIGRRGKREVPYVITRSNSKYANECPKYVNDGVNGKLHLV